MAPPYIIEDAKRARTIAVLRQMATGKTIELDGYTFGMAEDMTIGPIFSDGKIFALSEMTLSDFHALLNKNNIGGVIPDVK